MFGKLRGFFFPSAEAPMWQRVLPYIVMGLLTILAIFGGISGWEYTNSTSFCGETCHTMPPQYTTYQISVHAQVDCVECHLGRDYLGDRLVRKLTDIRHGRLYLFNTFEYPIRSTRLRPVRETCELCHHPTVFSDDSLRQEVEFNSDAENTRFSTYLAMRTGGGTRREGLGYGIHWHVENEVWFVSLDELDQMIPYVRVVGPEGEEDVYVALDSPVPAEELAGMQQERIDCISCHNRTGHAFLSPEQAVDDALAHHQIDATIPHVRSLAVDVLSADYATAEEAEIAIRSLADTYANEYPDFYAENEESIGEAIEALVSIQTRIGFPDQEVNWETHPDNIGHLDWPGCFRCHDGQHINSEQEIIRLECNLCHSIPLVAGPEVIEPMLPLATGVQPDSHYSTHWIALHRETFDQTCQACHNVSNPGGADNTSFCSNSACHGVSWEYANLDAPGLADVLAEEAGTAGEAEAVTSVGEGSPTFTEQIGPLLVERCAVCHSADSATGSLVLETYAGTLAGGESGDVIILGDGEGSLLVQIIHEGHFAQLSDDELQMVIDWIDNEAPED